MGFREVRIGYDGGNLGCPGSEILLPRERGIIYCKTFLKLIDSNDAYS